MTYQDTSREAWASFVGAGARLDRSILEQLDAAGPEGLTCQELEEKLERAHQSVSGNLRHLATRELVFHTGDYGTNSSGRRAMKWASITYRARRQLSLFGGGVR